MGCIYDRIFFQSGLDNAKEIPSELWSIKLKDIDGKDKTLSDYTEGKKAFIFVNVACKCSLTSENYTQLQNLYAKYKDDGLQVFAFPCGQFMNQEYSSEKEIKDFVSKQFEVDFPMFNKIEVNGDKTHAVYKYLKSNCDMMKTPNGLRNIPWNFSKFLVNKDGKVLGFYGPRVNPNGIVGEIEELLQQQI